MSAVAVFEAATGLFACLMRTAISTLKPNQPMLQAGLEYCLTPELLALKRPRFDSNDRFDFSVFETKFDAVVARSIWSHASKEQIRVMLDYFCSYSNPDAFFLTS